VENLSAPQILPVTEATRRILLLDDQEDFRELLAEYLTGQSFEVTGVGDGAAGLRAILRETFDLIVCDMMMAKVGGEMFYWAVSRVRPAARLRFIFITGHQNDPTVQHFFKRIDATVLVKPFRLEDLKMCFKEVEQKLR
jgi:DNA-binding NtrC family response regulator